MAKATAVKKTAKPAAKKAPAKKVTVKKVAPKKESKSERSWIKYEDKSKGQPQELMIIWEKIRTLLLPYAKGEMKIHGGSGGQITLINHKPYEVAGRKRPELWFAAALVQKGYVGFYFMPVFGGTSVKDIFKPELLKCLKGKSCFHIKNDDPELYKQIKDSLKLGYASYKKLGWV